MHFVRRRREFHFLAFTGARFGAILRKVARAHGLHAAIRAGLCRKKRDAEHLFKRLHGESRWRPRGLKWRLSTRAALNRRCLPKREQKGAVMGAVPGVHRLLKPVQAKPIAVAIIKTTSKIVIVKPTSMTR